jgi:hypothetical protein
LKDAEVCAVVKKEKQPITPSEINRLSRDFWADPLHRAESVIHTLAGHITESVRAKSRKAKAAADARHDAAGGSREKQQAIRDAWTSGKYTNRDRCAEEECGALGMSFSAARKALRNVPGRT